MSTSAHPQHSTREMRFRNGTALGISNKWTGGQYCTILTATGIIGCGIYDMRTAAAFNQAVAIARGTPTQPLVEPEDLLDAKIVDCTPLARRYGVAIGMTGRDAVECLLAAAQQQQAAQQ